MGPATLSRYLALPLPHLQSAERAPSSCPRAPHVEQPRRRHVGAPRSLGPWAPVLPSANGTHDYARRPPCCTSQRPVSESIAEGLLGLATGRQCQRQCPSTQPAVSPRHARLQSERAHVSAVRRRIEPDTLLIKAAWKYNLCLCRCERKSFLVWFFVPVCRARWKSCRPWLSCGR
jgi:hypothetical protein